MTVDDSTAGQGAPRRPLDPTPLAGPAEPQGAAPSGAVPPEEEPAEAVPEETAVLDGTAGPAETAVPVGPAESSVPAGSAEPGSASAEPRPATHGVEPMPSQPRRSPAIWAVMGALVVVLVLVVTVSASAGAFALAAVLASAGICRAVLPGAVVGLAVRSRTADVVFYLVLAAAMAFLAQTAPDL